MLVFKVVALQVWVSTKGIETSEKVFKLHRFGIGRNFPLQYCFYETFCRGLIYQVGANGRSPLLAGAINRTHMFNLAAERQAIFRRYRARALSLATNGMQ